MEVEELKLGMYGLCMQSYGRLLEAVLSDFKVTFRHWEEKLRKAARNIRIIVLWLRR